MKITKYSVAILALFGYWIDVEIVAGNYNTNCTEGEECVSLGIGFLCSQVCTCERGYTYHSSSETCKALDGYPCKSKAQCYLSESICDTNTETCQCRQGYKYSLGQQICRAVYGGICSSDLECGDTNNVCTAGFKCGCARNYTYSVHSKVCKAHYGGSCSSSADCYEQHNVCHSGTCVCDSNHILDQSTSRCAGRLGTPCEREDFCRVRPYMQCSLSQRRCTCQSGYQAVSGLCKAEHGSLCSSHSECLEPHNQCDIGDRYRCVCDAFYRFDGSRCRPKYDGTCSADSDCVDIFNVCDEQSRCSCAGGYTYQTDVKTCKAEYGSLCYNTAQCEMEKNVCNDGRCECEAGFRYHNGICKALYGSICAATSECFATHTICSSNFTCDCDSGYVHISRDSVACRALNGEVCSSDTECLDPKAQCEMKGSLTCVCKSGYLLSTEDNTCKGSIDESCQHDADCFSHNSQCSSRRCSCLPGYEQDISSGSHHCLASYQTICALDSDCVDASAVCTSGLCDCQTDQVHDPVEGVCRVKQDELCSVSALCISYADCIGGLCSCQSGYINTTSGFCKGGDGAVCNHSSLCYNQHSSCVDDVCMCDEGYHFDKTLCKVTLGNICRRHVECYGSNVQCTGGTCQCTYGFEPSIGLPPKSCLASYALTCSSSGDCASGVCNRDNRCGCAAGHKFNDLTGSCKALHNATCYSDDDCYDSAGSCVKSKCQCSVGYQYNDQSLTCTDVDDCIGTPCVNGGSCLDHVGRYECTCPELYSGLQCQISTDYCRKILCSNGGSCINGETKFICECMRGFTGKTCQISAPTEIRDLVRIDISVPLSTSVESSQFYDTIRYGLSAALDLAYCRRHNLHPDCRALSRRRRRQAADITWSAHVDRAQRGSTDTPLSVTVLFTARKNHRLQAPAIIVSLLSILQSMELAIKLGYRVTAKPTVILSSSHNYHLCWIRSVFNDSRLKGGSSMHITNSLEARLSVAVQSALRIRERSLLGNGSHDETTYSYHNSTAVIVDMRRYQNNYSIEVIYQAMLNDECYSATEMSRLLNRFTAEQFTRITLEEPLIIAQAYNKSDTNSIEEYRNAFVVVTRMPLTVQLDNLGVWSRLEKRVAEMMEFVLDTNDLPSPSSLASSRPQNHVRDRRAYSIDLITCKLMRLERVNRTSTVLLVVHVTKQDKPLNPHSIVQVLRTVDVNDLAIYLKEIIDESVVAYVYLDRGSLSVNSDHYLSLSIGAYNSTFLSCEQGSPYYQHTGQQTNMRYWVRTVTKVPYEILVLDSAFSSAVQERLSLLMYDAFTRQSDKEAGSYTPLHLRHRLAQRRKRATDQGVKSLGVCAKVVWIRRLNDSSSHTEIVYYVQKDQQPVRAITVVNLLHNYDIQELAVALSQVIHIQAEVYGQDQARSQTDVSSGREFLVTFLENYVESDVSVSHTSLKVVLTTCENRVVRVVIQSPRSDVVYKEVTVTPLQASTVDIPYSLMLRGTECAYKSLRISSDGDLTVTAVNQDYLSRDSYTVQPITRLAHTYYVISYYPSSLGTQFALVAREDNTRVDITFPTGEDITVILRGQSYTGTMSFIMRQYEAAQIQSYSDLSGTRVKTDKPVALYSGNICTNIRGKSRDHLVDQLLPEQHIGRSFIIVPYTGIQSTGTLIKVISTENDTTLYYPDRGFDVRLRRAGEHNIMHWDSLVDDSVNEGHFLFADKPVMVAMFSYSGGDSESGSVGDPSMSVIRPMSAYQSRYRFTLPEDANYTHSIQLAIEYPEYESLRLNDRPLANSIHWTTVPGTAPSIVTASLPLSPGTYSLHHQNPYITFLLHVYGATLHESYSYEAGSCRNKFNSADGDSGGPFTAPSTSPPLFSRPTQPLVSMSKVPFFSRQTVLLLSKPTSLPSPRVTSPLSGNQTKNNTTTSPLPSNQVRISTPATLGASPATTSITSTSSTSSTLTTPNRTTASSTPTTSTTTTRATTPNTSTKASTVTTIKQSSTSNGSSTMTTTEGTTTTAAESDKGIQTIAPGWSVWDNTITPGTVPKKSGNTEDRMDGSTTVDDDGNIENVTIAAEVTLSTGNTAGSDPESTRPSDISTTNNHPSLPMGVSTRPYWLAMRVASPQLPSDAINEKAVEETLLDLYLAALQMTRKKRMAAKAHAKHALHKRYAEVRSYRLQVVNCIWVDVGECDLVFYIQQNHVEIDAEVAVTVFHRLTTNYFKSYMTGVQVFSHVRVYFPSTSTPSITSAPGLSPSTQEGSLPNATVEEFAAGDDSNIDNTSVTGWVIGAVALACFVMAAACFTVRKCASQEEQTWIQRRLSRDKPKTESPVKADKIEKGEGDIATSPESKKRPRPRRRTKKAKSVTSQSEVDESHTVTAAGEGPSRPPHRKRTRANNESKAESKAEREARPEKSAEEELEKIASDNDSDPDKDIDETVAQFEILAQQDKAKNKEKMRRRSRLRKRRQSMAAEATGSTKRNSKSDGEKGKAPAKSPTRRTKHKRRRSVPPKRKTPVPGVEIPAQKTSIPRPLPGIPGQTS